MAPHLSFNSTAAVSSSCLRSILEPFFVRTSYGLYAIYIVTTVVFKGEVCTLYRYAACLKQTVVIHNKLLALRTLNRNLTCGGKKTKQIIFLVKVG